MSSHQWSLELLYLNMHIWIWHYWGCWINDDFMIHSGVIKFHIWLVSADLGKSFVPLWGLVELHQQLLTWHQLWWGIPPVLHVCNTACNKFITYHQFFLLFAWSGSARVQLEPGSWECIGWGAQLLHSNRMWKKNVTNVSTSHVRKNACVWWCQKLIWIHSDLCATSP